MRENIPQNLAIPTCYAAGSGNRKKEKRKNGHKKGNLAVA